MVRKMKIIRKAIKNAHCLVFMDLEATAFSHELIEIGAYRVLLDDMGKPIKVGPPFRRFVKARNPIGRIVVNLTGITEEKLKKEGTPFKEAIEEFRQYVGGYWKSARFVTFGSHDVVIMHSSAAMNKDADPEMTEHIIDLHFDFQSFLSQYVQDQNGNPYSLHNYLNIFEIPFEGREHDALSDAYNLYRLYNEIFIRTDILAKQYELALAHNKRLPAPLKDAFKTLSEGKDLTVDRWESSIKETFK